jgi:hypothetical protein
MKVSTVNPIFVLGVLFGIAVSVLYRLGIAIGDCLTAILSFTSGPLARGVEYGEKLCDQSHDPEGELFDEV